jgi:1-acyl-sn-glycerol-3-phosphate acyltransferase
MGERYQRFQDIARKQLAYGLEIPVRYGIEKLLEGTAYQYEIGYQNFEEKLKALVEEQDSSKPTVLLFYSNHTSFLDAGVAIQFIQSTRQLWTPDMRQQGCIMPVAATLKKGLQSNVSPLYFDVVREVVSDMGVTLVPVVRDGDHKEGQRQGLKEIVKASKLGSHVAVFPEATMKGGRKDEHTGELIGMVRAGEDIVQRNLHILAKHNYVICLPFGIDGTKDAYSNMSKKPTEEAILGILGWQSVPHIGVYVGEPFSGNELLETMGKDNPNIGHCMMGQIARLLPEEMQGVYQGTFAEGMKFPNKINNFHSAV